jgi:hypothetical protein
MNELKIGDYVRGWRVIGIHTDAHGVIRNYMLKRDEELAYVAAMLAGEPAHERCPSS